MFPRFLLTVSGICLTYLHAGFEINKPRCIFKMHQASATEITCMQWLLLLTGNVNSIPMYKATLITLFILCTSYVSNAQSYNEQIRQLTAALKRSSPDTNRVKLYSQLATAYFNKNGHYRIIHDSSMYYSQQEEILSTSLHYMPGLIQSYKEIIEIYAHNGDVKERSKQEHKDEDAKGSQYEEKLEALLKSLHTPPKEMGDTYMELEDLYDQTEQHIPHKKLLCEKAQQAYKRAGTTEEQMNVLMKIGFYEVLLGNFINAEKALLNSIAVGKAAGRKDLQETYSRLGNVYTMKGDFKLGLQYGLNAERIADSQKDTSLLLADIYNFIGMTYEALPDLSQAAKYYNKALLIAERYQDLDKIINFASNVSQVMFSTDVRKAVDFLENLMRKYPIPPENENNLILYNRMLAGYTKLKDYGNAQVYCDKLLAIAAKFPPTSPRQSFVYGPVIKYYMATKQYEQASKLMPPFMEIAQGAGVQNSLQLGHLWMYEIDNAAGNYQSALNHYREYKRLQDSAYNLSRTREIAQLQVQFETEKKDKDLKLKEQNIALLTKQGEVQLALNEKQDRDLQLKEQSIALLTKQQEIQKLDAEKKDQDIQLKEQNISLLTKEGQLQDAQLRQTKTTSKVIIGGAAMLLVMMGLGYNRYQVKQKANREINEKNIALQNLVTEKEWLLKEVHHRVKNNLQTVVSLLESQSAYLQSDALLAIQDSRNRVYAMSLIHQKLYQAENVAAISMSTYLPELINYLRDSFDTRQSIQLCMDIAPVELDVSQAIPIGLIVNEAVTNAIKYAFPLQQQPQEITITLTASANNRIALIIADNGIGMPPEFNINKSSSLGLKLIKGLTGDISGDFHIESHNGTKISIAFTANTPLHKTSEATLSQSISEVI